MHKFNIAGHEGYCTVGLYEDGRPGELFISMSKQGSIIHGLMDAVAILTSISLQHGVPLRVLCEKFTDMRFEPNGWSDNQSIGYAKSILDYIFRWMAIKFLGDLPQVEVRGTLELVTETKAIFSDSPLCSNCGTLMQRAGSCYSCSGCGATSGCG